MHSKTVLINGIGIAGPTLAYWPQRYGFKPTLVERSPALRENGYMIDFWGGGYEVAERMGLLTAIRRSGYQIEEVRLVDSTGAKLSGFNADVVRKALGRRFISIERGLLAKLIFEHIKENVEALFDDTIVALERSDAGVCTHFEKAPPRMFDFVVGADGLHSTVRSLLFGANGPYEAQLGFKVAAFNATGYGRRDDGAYVSYCAPGKQIARYALRHDRTGFLFIFRAAARSAQDLGEEDRRALIRDTFSGIGWETDEILRTMDGVRDLYFDDVSQIHLPDWSRGRVVLVGDAAFCPSLMAGEGASLAMSAAYVLAGKLKESQGDCEHAFKRYEETFKPFVTGKQNTATRLGAWFAPKTRFGIVARNAITELMNISWIGQWVVGRMIVDQFTLPDYEGTT